MYLLRKAHESDDVITKNWLYGLPFISKHSCFELKEWLFELFYFYAVKIYFYEVFAQ